jgi:hypothetical protein
VGNSPQLLFDSPIDVRMIVAMDITPQAADTIEITPALIIDEPIAFPSFD